MAWFNFPDPAKPNDKKVEQTAQEFLTPWYASGKTTKPKDPSVSNSVQSWFTPWEKNKK